MTVFLQDEDERAFRESELARLMGWGIPASG